MSILFFISVIVFWGVIISRKLLKIEFEPLDFFWIGAMSVITILAVVMSVIL